MPTIKLGKGYIAEEVLRNYFIRLGYFAVRGVALRYENVDLTDIDILLFGKKSPLSRERINVDAKNKKSSQVSERIFFAAGICSLLKFNSYIVATTDQRECIRNFTVDNHIQLLDGQFLKKLCTNFSIGLERISEENLLKQISQDRLGKLITNYTDRYQLAKSRLASNLTFSTCNELISDCHFFAKAVLDDAPARTGCLRALYSLISFFLIVLDYIHKDLALLSDEMRHSSLREGFTYGEIGFSGMQKYSDTIFAFLESEGAISQAILTNTKQNLITAFESLPSNIFSDYFSQNQVARELFKIARDFDGVAFATSLPSPDTLPASLKSILFIFLDYFDIDRTAFVEKTK
jgi:hypothetical protein